MPSRIVRNSIFFQAVSDAGIPASFAQRFGTSTGGPSFPNAASVWPGFYSVPEGSHTASQDEGDSEEGLVVIGGKEDPAVHKP